MNRRSLLKFLGAGSVAAPVIGPKVIAEAFAPEALTGLTALSSVGSYFGDSIGGPAPDKLASSWNQRLRNRVIGLIKGKPKALDRLNMDHSYIDIVSDLPTTYDAFRSLSPAFKRMKKIEHAQHMAVHRTVLDMLREEAYREYHCDKPFSIKRFILGD